jgi:hypothetical protein
VEYHREPDAVATRRVTCGDSGEARTVTFLLDDAVFPGKGYAEWDFRIRAVDGDAIIRFVRVIKLVPPR